MFLNIEYKISEEGEKQFKKLSELEVIDEIQECIAQSYKTIKIGIQYSEETGLINIVSVNNHSICQC